MNKKKYDAPSGNRNRGRSLEANYVATTPTALVLNYLSMLSSLLGGSNT